MSSFSLTFYETRPRGENRFVDNLIGASFINSDLINNSGSVSTNGERSGEQLYGSLSLRDTYSKNKFNFTPKLKINYGITHFAAYKETGAEGLNLNFNPLIKFTAKSLNQKTADSDIKIAIHGASTSARSNPNWSNILLLLF